MCDTFIALPDATTDGSVIFAKNSDRPAGEGQSVRTSPAALHAEGTKLRCTYIEIPQAPLTLAVLLSQIDWMWGAEMGANENGVVIGNEAVWTRSPGGPPALLGMDLLRLGLERGTTARNALDVMTALLERHGQGGACAENDPGFTYDNSYIIADANEAWVLETAGRDWVALRVTNGTRNISNRLSIRTGHDLQKPGLDPSLDFAARFSDVSPDMEPGSREAIGAELMCQKSGTITPETMFEILGNCNSGICMHGMFETTSSMVSRLHPDGKVEHWMTGTSHPCRSPFRRVELTS